MRSSPARLRAFHTFSLNKQLLLPSPDEIGTVRAGKVACNVPLLSRYCINVGAANEKGVTHYPKLRYTCNNATFKCARTPSATRHLCASAVLSMAPRGAVRLLIKNTYVFREAQPGFAIGLLAITFRPVRYTSRSYGVVLLPSTEEFV
jgi:hypothetical protein